MHTIYQKASKLIKNIALISMVLPVMALASSAHQMGNPDSKNITLRLAVTKEEHGRGLSGLKPSQFSNDEGMLFINDSMGTRRFWMPDTYFNLDIIFLDQDLKIVAIEKNALSHPGSIEPPVIYRTKSYLAQYILETKASTPFSKKLKVGDKLKWISSTNLSEITPKTRPQQ